MDRKEWIKFIKEFHGLSFFSWLTLLPIGDGGTKIGTAPIVCLPFKDRKKIEKKLKKHKMCFADSTIITVEGYHHPKGTITKAIVKPNNKWWEENPDGQFSWIIGGKT